MTMGCNEPFSPKGPFRLQQVAYGLLNAQSDTQYVLLYLNYNPPGYGSAAQMNRTFDTAATVTVASPTQSFAFHDTLLTPTIHAFVTQNFHPIPGTQYTLNASSATGVVSAMTEMPPKGVIEVRNQSPLFYPSSFSSGNIEIDVTLGAETKGYLAKFVLLYSLERDTSYRAGIEIPLSFVENSAGTLIPVYPQLQRATDPHQVAEFPVSNYLQIIAQLTDQFATRIILKEAHLYLLQVDKNLYDYFNVTNGFRDPYSIRTDQPDFTNIQGGYGVFGSFNADSLVIKLQ